MKEEPQSATQYAYQILLNQNAVLAEIITQQRILRTAVTAKDWKQVERAGFEVNALAERFSYLENERMQVFKQLCSEKPDDIFEVARDLPPAFRRPVIEAFHQVRQKLAVSKIENEALNEYIRITRNFLQEVFDSVLPQRRNTLYSSAGTVVKVQPESVVLNTII
ncbi:hypothetical protein [Treponema lecithinolyticum]|jgi:hypothetical protein|uniref:hypothetical protein n=1 Tax=Treponema lecithinolyticum TaxID=53418 RepID=UPI0028E2C9D0|nr:hypothetical protein [Treponema lecithinolyticum]